MKRKLLIWLMALVAISCEVLPDEGSMASLRLQLGEAIFTKSSVLTGVPDSSQFLLNLTSAGGETIFDGLYGDAPQKFSLNPGSYSVSIRSSDPELPAFAQPVFGDDQVVKLKAGSNMSLRLECTLLNCGIQLFPNKEFVKAEAGGKLALMDKDGRLDWDFAESRTAFFQPGQISIILNRNGEDKTLASRTLNAREILRLKILAGGGGTGTNITDTTVIWKDDTLNTGGNGKIMDVAQARAADGATGVWVYGYIVGNASPFLATTSATNLAISGKAKPTGKDECMSVELKKGALRDALNLVDNPSLLGRKVFLKGDITKYYSMPGIKNISDWSLDSPPSED